MVGFDLIVTLWVVYLFPFLVAWFGGGLVAVYWFGFRYLCIACLVRCCIMFCWFGFLGFDLVFVE